MPGNKVSRDVLVEAVAMAARVGYAFVATADDRGWPHLAAAGRLGLSAEGHLVLAEWFCPGTMQNLQVNPRLGIIVWDAVADFGYQMIGELEGMKDVSVLDGYAPGVEQKIRVPQVEREITVHVDRILEFKRAPHSDIQG